jgi:heme/copper-type cytochrome/quinol oxidase subunit 1
MSFLRRFGILILGTLFVIGGVVGYVALFPQPSFGWTAYAPLTGETFTPHPYTFDYLGGLALVGLVLVAGWVGHWIGRRGRRTASGS